MPRSWDHHEVLGNRRWIVTFKDDLGIWLGIQFSAINDSLCFEMIGKLTGIGYIIPVRQKDEINAAEFLQSPDNWFDEFR